MSNPEIAKRQGVSTDAIKYHIANALQKLGFSSRADLRTWGGVRRDSHLFKQHMDRSKPMKLGAVGQIARSVKDIEGARNWYGDVLGLEHLYSFGNLAFFDCGGLRLFLSEGDGGTSESIIYFSVGDVRTASAALEKRESNSSMRPT
jgi:hypothetical protein